MFGKKRTSVPVDCDNCNVYILDGGVRLSLMVGKNHIANIDCDPKELDELVFLLESVGKALKNKELLDNIEE